MVFPVAWVLEACILIASLSPVLKWFVLPSVTILPLPNNSIVTCLAPLSDEFILKYLRYSLLPIAPV